MSTDTGGPAFPSKKRIYRAGYATGDFEPVNGMTLRDYFAAKAMQGDIGSFPEHVDPSDVASVIARRAYQIADAMLKAREQ